MPYDFAGLALISALFAVLAKGWLAKYTPAYSWNTFTLRTCDRHLHYLWVQQWRLGKMLMASHSSFRMHSSWGGNSGIGVRRLSKRLLKRGGEANVNWYIPDSLYEYGERTGIEIQDRSLTPNDLRWIKSRDLPLRNVTNYRAFRSSRSE